MEDNGRQSRVVYYYICNPTQQRDVVF